MSRTIAAAAAAVRRRRLRHSDRRRRARHRHRDRARPDRLGARHRSEHADRRRRDRQRRRLALPAAVPAGQRGAPARRPTRPASSSPPCSATPRTPGAKSSRASGQQYRAPRLRLYRRRASRAAAASRRAAMGPFYCPNDREIYLDTSFFRDIETRFRGCSGKACEFAAGLCDRARGRPSRAEPARHPAEGAGGAARRRQQGGGQPHPGAGRIAGRLLRRRLGQSLRAALEVRSSRATSRRRCRPPPRSATTRCRSRRRATWCRTPSPTARPTQRKRWFTTGFKEGKRVGLQHLRGGARFKDDATCPASTKADNSCRSRSRC